MNLIITLFSDFIEQVKMPGTLPYYQAWGRIFAQHSIVRTLKCTMTVHLDLIHLFRLVIVEVMGRAEPVSLQCLQVISVLSYVLMSILKMFKENLYFE